jgi:hypothetical protein
MRIAYEVDPTDIIKNFHNGSEQPSEFLNFKSGVRASPAPSVISEKIQVLAQSGFSRWLAQFVACHKGVIAAALQEPTFALMARSIGAHQNEKGTIPRSPIVPALWCPFLCNPVEFSILAVT